VLNLKELSPLENAFATGEKGRKVKSIITQVLKTKSASEVFFILISSKVGKNFHSTINSSPNYKIKNA
jgi:hypothetical protein